MKYLITPFFLLLALVACAPTATPTAVPPTAPPASEPEPDPTATTVATTVATNGPIDKADLPQGRTEEGAFYLGNSDAPVKMLDYSNFL